MDPDLRHRTPVDSPDNWHETTDQKGAQLQAGLLPRAPRRMGCRPRCFNPSLPTRHAAGSSLHQRGGTPHPEYGPLAGH